jgi:hypothetical protein
MNYILSADDFFCVQGMYVCMLRVQSICINEGTEFEFLNFKFSFQNT